MNRTFTVSRRALLFACLLLTAAGLQAATKAEDAVRKADDEWARVFAARQIDPSVNACASNARVLSPNASVAIGHDQIRQLFAGFFALPNLKITWSADQVQVADSGELAYTSGHYDMSFTGPDGKLIPDHGKYVTVWQKQGGAWKVIVDCFNTDLPMPAPPPPAH